MIKYPKTGDFGEIYSGVDTDTDKRLDVLLVDSGGALLVMELKVVEDEGMLLQGIDYYDDVTRHLDSLIGAYEKTHFSSEQTPRLMLVSPGFSADFLSRCKWVSIPISFYSYQWHEAEDSRRPGHQARGD